MLVKDIMQKSLVCCTPDTRLEYIARMMAERDCGFIPIVNSPEQMKPVGVITDRDIVCRSLAKGHDPMTMSGGCCMTTPAHTVTPDMKLEDCLNEMERFQIRRMVVVDDQGRCCGVIAQADIARCADEHQAAELLREVSEPASVHAT
ncbi:MAG TPA: CBS domain-containing protein [Planctomycetota bacterium]|nr:CBS domain-containing protein [Planctomycetota bacterium]